MVWQPAAVGGAIGAATDVGMGFLEQMFAGKAADKAKNISRYFAKRKHQMEVHSLRRAGLNPILAAGRFGGATGPSVGHANVGSSGFSAGVGSALQAKRLIAELNNINMDTQKKEEEAYATATLGAKTRRESAILDETLNSAKAAAAAAKAEEEFWKSDVGKKMKKIDLFFRSLNPMTGAASSARSATR